MAVGRLSYELIDRARTDHANGMSDTRELLGRTHWVDPLEALHVVHQALDRRVTNAMRLQESDVAFRAIIGRFSQPDVLNPYALERKGLREKLKWAFIGNNPEDVSAFVFADKWQMAEPLLRSSFAEAELVDLCDFDRIGEGQLSIDQPLAIPLTDLEHTQVLPIMAAASRRSA